MELRIRTVREDELEGLARLYMQAYQGLERYGEPCQEEAVAYLDWLFSVCPEGFLVAEIREKPVGFLACCPDWRPGGVGERVLEIHEVAVAPDFRGRGIGRALLERALELGQARERKAAALWVGKGNAQAQAWYGKLGFREEGCWGEWIRMRRLLPEAKS